ncbi:MAG: TolC family protein [Desulfobacula sp.]|nr:TolC family protein [Desulfobacula sp.]
MGRSYNQMNKIIIIFMFFCIIASHTIAQAAQVFSMEESVEYALENSPVLQGLQIAVKQTDEDIKSARGYFLPSIAASYSLNSISSIYSKGPSDSDYIDQNIGVASVRLTQVLFSGFEYVNRYKKAKLGKEYQKAQVDVKKLDLINNVRSTFLELLKNRYDISIISQGITRLESDLAAAKALSSKKLVPYSQVLQAEADLEFARQRLWETRTSVFRYIERMNLLLGMPHKKTITNPVEYNGTFEQEEIDFTMGVDQCFDLAMKNRIEPKLLELEIKMARKDISISMGKYYPKMSFIAGLIDTDSAYGEPGILSTGQAYNRDQQNQYWEAGVFIRWDIFDGGSNYYQARKNHLQVQKLENDLNQVAMEITEDVLVAHKLFHETQKKLGSSKKAISAARESYIREQKRFNAKLTTISNVLSAQTQLVKSESLLSQALLDYKLSMVRLNHAMGIRN